MERKLKQIVVDWRKAEQQENKKELIRQLHALLFTQNQQQKTEKVKKKIDAKYETTNIAVSVGSKVLMKKNHQVGEVKEIRGKRAVVQVGLMPITVAVDDLVVVAEKN
jgi:DNA mismatch repair protein MutS2